MIDARPHLRAQAALVRMIYDPAFAGAVIAAPREALAHLPVALADALGAIDPRALRRDVYRRERTLGQLCAELPCATTLALAETRRMASLLDFYRSAAFHRAIDEGGVLVLALGAYLEEQLAEGALRSPHLAAVLALELASARARRQGEDAPSTPPVEHDRLRRARGVEPIDVPAGALATLQAIERHRFRLGLLPAWALVEDPPALPPLPPLGPGRETMVAVLVGGELSLVQIERPLHALLASLPEPRTRRALLAEAGLRCGGHDLEVALRSLLEDELIVSA